MKKHVEGCAECKSELNALVDQESTRHPDCLNSVTNDRDFSAETTDFTTDRKGTRHDSIPTNIGRYMVCKPLGQGGFGSVYLAYDPQTDRLVALKVPKAKSYRRRKDLEMLLREARNAGNLDHPRIVPIYDVQIEADAPFIVQKYIEGCDLQAWRKVNQPSFKYVVRILTDIVDGIKYAHQEKVYHLDLKPSNILIDQKNRAYIADFGVAVRANTQPTRAGLIQGTRPFMSPEQTRGETHQMDGRTDVWSIGVIMFELLTRTYPFIGQDSETLFDVIRHNDPKRLRELDPDIPIELERICLKCLEKRKTDRYIAADLLADLHDWYQDQADTPSLANSVTRIDTRDAIDTSVPVDTDKPQPNVVPKGLRSFDQHDADFFPQLLPGPYDRNGLSDSLRFWKQRIESTDPDDTFNVGLVYGPSGCGKSSLIKAGLLPRLTPNIRIVYVEAEPRGTESRILSAIANQVDILPIDCTLPDAIRFLRESEEDSRKLLIVVDQFEQWLHGRDDFNCEFADALRQCDGKNVQCLLMLRDDFWMAAMRFVEELDFPIQSDKNSRAVDLFTEKHARRVLTTFGQAYGDVAQPPTKDQLIFIAQAVRQLAKEGRVISVQLSLLAQMLHGKNWEPSNRQPFDQLGVAFLQSALDSNRGRVEFRGYNAAARKILNALLPDHSGDIKGKMRSTQELSRLAGWQNRPTEMNRVLQFLDQELRLITPTDHTRSDREDVVEVEATDNKDSNAHETHGERIQYYQLTHDYLVPSLRDWLTRKQRETRQGRAELCLAEAVGNWNQLKRRKVVTGFFDFFRIVILTNRRNWTASARRMMGQAARFYAALVCAAFAVTFVLLFVGNRYRINQRALNQAHQRSQGSLQQVRRIVDQFMTGPFDESFEKIKGSPGVEDGLLQVVNDAIVEYEAIHQNHPTEIKVPLELARNYYRKGQLLQFRKDYSNAQQAFAASSKILNNSLFEKNYEEAVTLDLAKSELQVGRIEYLQGNHESAREKFDVAFSLLKDSVDSINPRLQFTLATALKYQSDLLPFEDPEKRERLQEALQRFEEAYQSNTASAELLSGVVSSRNALGQLLLMDNEPIEALDLYNNAVPECDLLVRANGDDARLARLLRGNTFMHLGPLYRALCEPLRELEAFDHAYKDYATNYNSAPHRDDILRNLVMAQMNAGESLLSLGDLRGSMTLLENSTELSKKLGDDWLISVCEDRLVQAYLDFGNAVEAASISENMIQRLRGLAKQQPAHLAFAYLHAAQSQRALKNINDSQTFFELAIQTLNDDRSDASPFRQFQFAHIYSIWSTALTGDEGQRVWQLALAHWERLLANRPTPDQLQQFAWHVILQPNPGRTSLERVRDLAKKLLADFPTNKRFLELSAAADVMLGESESAVTQLRQIVDHVENSDTVTSDGRAGFFLALALHAQGDSDEATRQFRLATESMTNNRPGAVQLKNLQEFTSRTIGEDPSY